MALNITYSDISDFTEGFAYGRGQNYKLASYAAGWTITEIRVTGYIFYATSNEATNSSTWANPTIYPPITACLSTGAAGFTPVRAHAANYSNAQWLMLSEVSSQSVAFEVLNGSTEIGSAFVLPVNIYWPSQIRLAIAQDFYFQTFLDDSSAPEFQFQGTASVTAS